ncbi:hypothetical protein GCM10010289_68270 [Streptomyces violascens]|nr:hypothetical protein GCM10010289_68270 [Streptomyces violascens]
MLDAAACGQRYEGLSVADGMMRGMSERDGQETVRDEDRETGRDDEDAYDRAG